MSKVGQHNFGAVSPFTQRASVVKQFNSGVSTLLAAPADAVRVVRHYFSSQPYGPGQGIAAANAVIASLGGYRHPNLFVELYNEPDQADLTALCDLTTEAVGTLHQAGLRCAAFSWGTGQPEDAVWNYVAGRNWCGLDPANDAIALHEYSNDWNIDGWNMGRFQRLLSIDPRRHVIVTETGFDSGGGNSGGWMAHGSLDQLYDLLTRYDTLIGAHSQVLGATVFTAQPTPDWSNFSFDDPRAQFSIGENPMPYSVGPGFKQYMDSHGQEAASDEFYVASDQVSFAVAKQAGGGAKELLVYVKDTNEVKALPFS